MEVTLLKKKTRHDDDESGSSTSSYTSKLSNLYTKQKSFLNSQHSRRNRLSSWIFKLNLFSELLLIKRSSKRVQQPHTNVPYLYDICNLSALRNVYFEWHYRWFCCEFALSIYDEIHIHIHISFVAICKFRDRIRDKTIPPNVLVKSISWLMYFCERKHTRMDVFTS